MKKIFLGIALSLVVLQGCKKDDDEVDETVVLTVEEQNTYDDAAATKFMEDHYFNSKGLIVAFDSTTDTDDANPKLSSYPHEKLPSGVIYIKRTGAQPEPGKDIGSTDVISLFQVTKSYVSSKTNDIISFGSEATFTDNVLGSGVPIIDPAYYYVKQSVLDKYNTTNGTTYGRNIYEIEGLQEGLKYFKSYDNLDPATDYNLQGVIIVPSRAAFGRENNVYSYTNRSFVFNFQIYNSRARVLPDEN